MTPVRPIDSATDDAARDGRCDDDARVLIADDDAFVRTALRLQLKRSFTVLGDARDADEAIERVAALRPDVAILDVQMPRGGGLRATREIHRRAPEVAIVALSADASDSTVRSMLDAGAVTYVLKGMDGPQLARTLRAAITSHAGAPVSRPANLAADTPATERRRTTLWEHALPI
ncbi:MAG TPA: response regulator transcription factor [Solirubrobacteraceae bacterium]|nr:response regulator transcription factor [Solirubrobacteraceae bacterium]